MLPKIQEKSQAHPNVHSLSAKIKTNQAIVMVYASIWHYFPSLFELDDTFPLLRHL